MQKNTEEKRRRKINVEGRRERESDMKIKEYRKKMK